MDQWPCIDDIPDTEKPVYVESPFLAIDDNIGELKTKLLNRLAVYFDVAYSKIADNIQEFCDILEHLQVLARMSDGQALIRVYRNSEIMNGKRTLLLIVKRRDENADATLEMRDSINEARYLLARKIDLLEDDMRANGALARANQ